MTLLVRVFSIISFPVPSSFRFELDFKREKSSLKGGFLFKDGIHKEVYLAQIRPK